MKYFTILLVVFVGTIRASSYSVLEKTASNQTNDLEKQEIAERRAAFNDLLAKENTKVKTFWIQLLSSLPSRPPTTTSTSRQWTTPTTNVLISTSPPTTTTTTRQLTTTTTAATTSRTILTTPPTTTTTTTTRQVTTSTTIAAPTIPPTTTVPPTTTTVKVTDYCNPTLCPAGSTHIACRNSGVFSPSCPADRQLVNLLQSDIQLILNVHNTFRNKIASGAEPGFNKAARMATMTWNVELASLAELNVKQCQMKHDDCISTVDFKYAGQNLGMRGASDDFLSVQDVITATVNAWYGEVFDANQVDINTCCKAQSGKVIGHFTQVVTDRAIKVGCAVSRFTRNSLKYSLLACNYAFTNLRGSPVYVSGNSASGCRTGINPSFPALCSVNENISAAV